MAEPDRQCMGSGCERKEKKSTGFACKVLQVIVRGDMEGLAATHGDITSAALADAAGWATTDSDDSRCSFCGLAAESRCLDRLQSQDREDNADIGVRAARKRNGELEEDYTEETTGRAEHTKI
jgi:hypothetical protein